MKICPSFTHLHVTPNLYDFISSAEHKIRYFELLIKYFFDHIKKISSKFLFILSIL